MGRRNVAVAGVPRGSARRRGIRRQLPASPWLFLAPGLLVVGGFSLYPFLSTVARSFTDARTLTAGRFTGGANYREMVHDPMFWTGLRNSVLYVVGVVPP